MKPNTHFLDELSPDARFTTNRRARFNELAIQAYTLSTTILSKRDRLDSAEFTESVIKRNRGISDALPPDLEIVLDEPYNRRRRRSSMLMMRELPQFSIGELCGVGEEEARVESVRVDEKVESRRKRDCEGFDLGVPKSRKRKDNKVGKGEKENEDCKTSAVVKKRCDSDDKKSVDSCIQQDESAIVDGEEPRQNGFVPEKMRLKTKINKVNTYWDRRSLYIPNVFRLARLIDDDSKNLLEFQDYSKKSVLVQGQSPDRKKSSVANDLEDDVEDIVEHIQRRSLCIVLDHPEDMLAFLK